MPGAFNPQLPLWDYRNFNNQNFVGYGFNNNNWNTNFFTTPFGYTDSTTTSSSSSSSSSKSSSNSYEARQKQIQFFKEKNQEILKQQQLINCKQQAIDAIKKGKKSDGSAIVDSYKLAEPQLKDDGTIDSKAMQPKKKGFWDKACSWAGSAGTALLNIGKSLIGYDEKGNWSAKKLAKNIAITAAALGASFIPVVGPAITYGLLAFGVGSGVVGVANGISKLNKARTAEEEEQARQEICSGAFVGISSAAGLRGLGKSVSASASAASTKTLGVNALAKSRTGFFGKMLQNTSQFTRDISVNALKATGNAMNTDKTLIATQGGGISGFFRAMGSKIKTAWDSVNSTQHKYNKQYSDMESSLQTKINELNNQIATETNAAKKALLQEKQNMLQKNLDELHNVLNLKTKTEFEKLKTENTSVQNQETLSSYQQNARGGYEINGHSISQQRFNTFKKEMQAAQKQYNKDLSKLVDSKHSMMRSYGRKPDAYRTEINEYTEAAIRNKYNTPEKLKNGIETLTGKLSDLEVKIAETEAKIARATSPRKINALRRTLDGLKSAKLKTENELSVCTGIKFKSWWKPSTWFKNDELLYIGESNATAFGWLKSSVSGISKPAAMPVLADSQWNHEFSAPLLGGDISQLSSEQAEETLKQLEKEKQDLEKVIKELKNITKADDWEALKQKVAAQQQAQQAQQAQAS